MYDQTNIDWAGIILERVTGQKLGDYFAEHIFAPLGIPVEGATMFPDQNAQKNLAKMQQRDASGVLKAREHLYSAPLKASKDQQGNIFQSGGAGLFAKPREYVKLLAAIINDGTDPKSGKQILKKESVDQLWVNRIPNQYVSFPSTQFLA
jgi:CubicO group peptidase (beta-lactamase class C family)